MEVYDRLDAVPRPGPKPAALTLGCFDGVHAAHRKIIDKVVERKGADCDSAGLITFSPCPILVFGENNGGRCLITPMEEKLDLLEKSGLDWVLALPFDAEFQRMEAEEFVRRILVEKLNAGAVVAGHDVGFGYKRGGDAALLRAEGKRYTFKVQVLEPLRCGDMIISSTAVRRAVLDCDFPGAEQLLGRRYRIRGPVMRGNRLGRTIGLPTANVDVHPNKLLPPEGVYAAFARLDGHAHPAVLSIGVRPTVDNSGALAIEAHILDFSSDIYGHTLTLEPVAYIRGQQKFESMEILKQNIHNDISRARKILNP